MTVEEYRHLLDDWDGKGALAPHTAVLRNLDTLARRYGDPVSLQPGFDGTTSCRWTARDSRCVVVDLDGESLTVLHPIYRYHESPFLTLDALERLDRWLPLLQER